MTPEPRSYSGEWVTLPQRLQRVDVGSSDWILDLLVSLEPADRERGAEEAADAAPHLADPEAFALVGALIALWVREDEDRVREAQLNALTALVNQVAVPRDLLAPLLQCRERAIRWEIDYFNEIEDVTRLRGL